MGSKSKSSEQVYLALLRGINVGGNKLVPMAELRALATKLGLSHVETYIQSGNLLFVSSLEAMVLEAMLEKAIAKKFGFAVEVLVRDARAWQVYASGSPFPEAQTEHPKTLVLGLVKKRVTAAAAKVLEAAARDGERVRAAGDALWIDYGGGIGRSKLSPAVLDRAAGSTVTGRNWTTVQRLAELAARIEAQLGG